MPTPIDNFLSEIQTSINSNAFVKLNLGNYNGTEAELKKIYIKRVIIKREDMLSFVYRYKTKDITKNYSIAQSAEEIKQALGASGFRNAQLFTIQADFILQQSKNTDFILQKTVATIKELPSLSHDKQKNRKIDSTGKQYLHELRITDAQGNVYKKTQDKFKQINHYIEILSSLLKALPDTDKLNIVDMGSGKGYLTFALYDYLTNTLKRPTSITGIEFRADLVKLCNQIATKSAFEGLEFEEGTIDSYQAKEKLNILIALHACDTATDDAIYKGITNQADLIVVAPCCHKQVRREIEKGENNTNLDFLLKHGTFLERQAEMVTDGIRTLILEHFGYSTKVLEFISDAHTPKNVLIIGTKKEGSEKNLKALEEIKKAKETFRIGQHHLEGLLEL